MRIAKATVGLCSAGSIALVGLTACAADTGSPLPPPTTSAAANSAEIQAAQTEATTAISVLAQVSQTQPVLKVEANSALQKLQKDVDSALSSSAGEVGQALPLSSAGSNGASVVAESLGEAEQSIDVLVAQLKEPENALLARQALVNVQSALVSPNR